MSVDHVPASRLVLLLRESANALDAEQTRLLTGEETAARTHAFARVREAATRLEALDGLIDKGPCVMRHVIDTGTLPAPRIHDNTSLEELEELLDGNQLQVNVTDDGYEASIVGIDEAYLGEGTGDRVAVAINNAYRDWRGS